jgi:hypothetical protein
VARPWDKIPQSGRGPYLSADYPLVLHAGHGSRVVMFVDDRYNDAPWLATCADHACRGIGYRWVAPPPPELRRGGPSAASVRLPDGRLVVTRWSRRDAHGKWAAWPMVCDHRDCTPMSGGRPMTTIPGAHLSTVALAARPGGGLVLVRTEALQEEADGWLPPPRESLSFTICGDPACSHQRTKHIARLPASLDDRGPQSLAVAVTPDDRPVAARVNLQSGAIHVLSCEDPACHRSRVTCPVAPRSPRRLLRERESDSARTGAALAVRKDGRPVIAYRDVHDGSIRLLDCRTRDCAQADQVALTGAAWDLMLTTVLNPARWTPATSSR